MISRLHVITQDGLPRTHLKQAELALKGGAKLIQFRTKKMAQEAIETCAKELLILTKAHKAKLLMNDHWQLAIDLGLDGVHVGLTDTPISEIRRHTDFIIGGTANTFEDIKTHYKAGADYVGLGPFRFTKTKNNLSPTLGQEGYKDIIRSCRDEKIRIPIIAIGGVHQKDVSTLKSIGLHGIAIASQINLSTKPEEATQDFLKKLG